MSINDSFDNCSDAVISPTQIVQKVDGFPEIALVTFQAKAYDQMIESYGAKQINQVSCGRIVSVDQINYKGIDIAMYLSPLGGSAAAAVLEEIIVKGAKKILFFGSCGALGQQIAAGHYIVPSAAYRDEGTSYHYAPPSDYLEIHTADRLGRLFEEIRIPHIKAKTWTTDGFYRETRNNVEARVKDGCVCVEMECASVMAVAQFRGVEAYQFLYAADSLANEHWDARILGNMPDDMREMHIRIAVEIASRLA